MEDYLAFEDRQAFRSWLEANCESSGGVWLLFGKKGGPKTLKAGEALEEALCFGWIDGLMKKLDDASYIKYFARRVPNSKWSAKNKGIAMKLLESGLIERQGLEAIEQAKQNGSWEASKKIEITDEQIDDFGSLLQGREPAYGNFMNMPRSVKRTYTGYYLDAKSDKTRQNRLESIAGRLDKNLKPMDKDEGTPQ